MEWKTERQTGNRVTTGIIAWLALFDVLLIWIALQLPVTLLTFVIGLLVLASLPAFGVLAYWLAGLRASKYWLDRNALTITWGPLRQVVPMTAIERLVPGEKVNGKVRFLGGYWPGLWVGRGQIEGLGPTMFYATTIAPAELLFAVTSGAVYAISPTERAKFLEAFEQRKVMGPTQEAELNSYYPDVFDWPLWHDNLARGLVGAAALVLMALFGFLAWRMQALPENLPLHFNSAGLPDRTGERAQVFILPLIGLLTWLVNTGLGGVAYQRRERFTAYLLWSGALLVQLLLWGATAGIFSR